MDMMDDNKRRSNVQRRRRHRRIVHLARRQPARIGSLGTFVPCRSLPADFESASECSVSWTQNISWM